jgi:hypothetical protein
MSGSRTKALRKEWNLYRANGLGVTVSFRKFRRIKEGPAKLVIPRTALADFHNERRRALRRSAAER